MLANEKGGLRGAAIEAPPSYLPLPAHLPIPPPLPLVPQAHRGALSLSTIEHCDASLAGTTASCQVSRVWWARNGRALLLLLLLMLLLLPTPPPPSCPLALQPQRVGGIRFDKVLDTLLLPANLLPLILPSSDPQATSVLR